MRTFQQRKCMMYFYFILHVDATGPALPHSAFLGLAGLVMLLGVKHGFDADHLAAIDSLTRFNSSARPQLARRAGALFSLGHGLVVVLVALTVSCVATVWQAPAWLEATGAWVSIAVLTLLGCVNLVSLWRTPQGEPIHPSGWRSRLFARILRAQHPGSVAAVGALFALSFDTLSQAALFAVLATRFEGWPSALVLAGLFMLGMLVSDGLNGLWVAHLVRRSDRAALISSRVMTASVATVGLLTAAVGVLNQSLPAARLWHADRAWWLSVLILVTLGGSFLLGAKLAQRQGAPGASSSPSRPYPDMRSTSTEQAMP